MYLPSVLMYICSTFALGPNVHLPLVLWQQSLLVSFGFCFTRDSVSLRPSLTLSSEQPSWLSLLRHESPSLPHFVLIPYGSSRRDESLWLKTREQADGMTCFRHLWVTAFPLLFQEYNTRNIKVDPY